MIHGLVWMCITHAPLVLAGAATTSTTGRAVPYLDDHLMLLAVEIIGNIHLVALLQRVLFRLCTTRIGSLMAIMTGNFAKSRGYLHKHVMCIIYLREFQNFDLRLIFKNTSI